ncbi:methyltransferase domain-containing protein [Phytomonospora sp. NPDC050363]|uniref:class I SAM-dependent methyltransferase n=1 Tax=Phytomonospora sp. NPDC050363 TaxID=3155642 RepID=UPI0033EAB106
MADITGDTRAQSRALEDVSAASHYRAWLTGLALDHLGEHPIEIGSGHGDYAAEWLSHVDEFTVTEGDTDRLQLLRKRFADEPRVHVRKLLLPSDVDGEYSAALAYNVLEHIPDDVAGLRTMARLVRPGGKVLIFVPAHPILMSDFDRRVGHVRRYRKETLRAAFEEAGLTVDTLQHVNWAGWFAWMVMMKLLKGTPKDSVALRAYDRMVVPAVRATERIARPPFGQSLLAVGRAT